MKSPTTAPLQVFVPFFRKKLVLNDFCEILQDTCEVTTAVVHTKIVRKSDGAVDLSKLHYYAFLTVIPTHLTKSGRNLARNLRNHVTTFVYYDGDGFIELKPFLTTQQRIERGYTSIGEERSEENSQSDVSGRDDLGGLFDWEGDRDWMIQEYDNLIREIYEGGLCIHHLT